MPHDNNDLFAARPLRSLLFCPGTDLRKMSKALRARADAVILDLEDSVAPADKALAREQVVKILGVPRCGIVAVRINAADTANHLADLAAVVRAAPDAIMLPKCGSAAELARLSAMLDCLEAAFALPAGRIAILPLVTESAAALLSLDYRGATPRLKALCCAGEDLASDLGVAARVEGQMNPLLAHARRQVAIAAAAACVPAIDTPFPDIANVEGLRSESNEAAFMGFSGKLCIHPAQIAAVHTAFHPPAERVAWGQAVIGALEHSATGVGTVDGKMVDIAHLRLAHRYVLRAGQEDVA